MRRKGEYVAAALLVVVAGATVGWLNYYPSSLMFRSLGLPGPRANSERSCGAWYRKYPWGVMKTREVTCKGPGRPLGAWDEQEVTLDRLTRRIAWARGIWPLADSAAWITAQDSVRQVLTATGGVELRCLAPDQIPGHTLTEKAWRFPTYSVRLIAYHFQRPVTPYGPPEWTLQLDGYPGDPPDCGAGAVRGPGPATTYK
jgi:hypothetical protein